LVGGEPGGPSVSTQGNGRHSSFFLQRDAGPCRPEPKERPYVGGGVVGLALMDRHGHRKRLPLNPLPISGPSISNATFARCGALPVRGRPLRAVGGFGQGAPRSDRWRMGHHSRYAIATMLGPSRRLSAPSPSGLRETITLTWPSVVLTRVVHLAQSKSSGVCSSGHFDFVEISVQTARYHRERMVRPCPRDRNWARRKHPAIVARTVTSRRYFSICLVFRRC